MSLRSESFVVNDSCISFSSILKTTWVFYSFNIVLSHRIYWWNFYVSILFLLWFFASSFLVCRCGSSVRYHWLSTSYVAASIGIVKDGTRFFGINFKEYYNSIVYRKIKYERSQRKFLVDEKSNESYMGSQINLQFETRLTFSFLKTFKTIVAHFKDFKKRLFSFQKGLKMSPILM